MSAMVFKICLDRPGVYADICLGLACDVVVLHYQTTPHLALAGGSVAKLASFVIVSS